MRRINAYKLFFLEQKRAYVNPRMPSSRLSSPIFQGVVDVIKEKLHGFTDYELMIIWHDWCQTILGVTWIPIDFDTYKEFVKYCDSKIGTEIKGFRLKKSPLCDGVLTVN